MGGLAIPSGSPSSQSICCHSSRIEDRERVSDLGRCRKRWAVLTGDRPPQITRPTHDGDQPLIHGAEVVGRPSVIVVSCQGGMYPTCEDF